MGLFHKPKKSGSKENNVRTVDRISIFETDYPMDRSNWVQVFSACLGKMIVIQEACSEQVVKGQDWNVDFRKGILSFGQAEYPVQFIGSEADSDYSWLWGYEHVNGFNDSLLELANEMKSIGEKWNLEPLAVPRFSLNDIFNGHNLSIVACGVSKGNYCYYRGPHDSGAVFMAFSGVPESVFAPIDDLKFASITMQCIQRFPVDHKIFVESLLMWNGTGYDWKDDRIIAHFPAELGISFEQEDSFMRISAMKTLV